MKILPVTILYSLLLVLSGCSLFGSTSNEEKAEVYFSVSRDLIDQSTFQLRITDNKRWVDLSNQDFDRETSLVRYTPYIEMTISEKLFMEFELLHPSTTEKIAHGQLEFRLEPKQNMNGDNLSHSVSFRADSAGFDGTCHACTGYESFAIKSEALDSTSSLNADSLYVIWRPNYPQIQ